MSRTLAVCTRSPRQDRTRPRSGNIEHNRADTARTPSPATRTAQREPQQASAALRQSVHPLPRGDPDRQGAHRQARASLPREGAREGARSNSGSGIRFKTAIPLGSQSPARPAHPSPVRGPVREPVPNSGSGIRFKAAILSPLGSQGPKAAKSATREDSSAAQVRERSAAPPSPPPPALHRHRLPSRRPDGGSTFRTMGSGRDRADSGPATSCKSEHLYEKI